MGNRLKHNLHWLVLMLMIIAFFAGSRGLGIDPIYGGEYHSVRHTGIFESADSIAYTFSSIEATSSDHAPFYFVFLYYWVRLISVHPIILRSLSLLAFVLSIAVGFRVGSLFIGRVGGVLTASFIGLSAFAVFYSHEVRMYAFMPVFSLTIIYFYWSIISAKERVKWHQWLGLFVVSLLSIYIHYSAIFLLVLIGLYHLFFVPKNRRWIQVAAVEVAAGIFFLPWLPVVLLGGERLSFIAGTSLPISDTLYHIIFVHTNGLWFVGAGLIVLALVSVRHRQSHYFYLLFVSIGTITLLLLVNEFVTTVLLIRRMRYTLIVLPLLALMFSMGLLQLWYSRLHIIGRVFVLALMGVWAIAGINFYQSDELVTYTNREAFRFYDYPPFHVARDLIDDLPGFGEPVLSAHPTVDVELPILLFYSNWTGREFNHLFNETDPEWIPRMPNRLNIVEDDESFWLIYDPRVTFTNGIDLHENILDSFVPCGTLVDMRILHMDYYVRNHISCDLIVDASPTRLVFENGLRLDNLVLDEISPSNYRIFSWWDAEQRVDSSPLGFSIRVLNDGNLPVLIEDYYMPSKTIGFNDLDLSNLLAGTYQIQLSVWNVDSGGSISSREVSKSGESMNEFSNVFLIELES